MLEGEVSSKSWQQQVEAEVIDNRILQQKLTAQVSNTS
jgi:hypothetical protein